MRAAAYRGRGHAPAKAAAALEALLPSARACGQAPAAWLALGHTRARLGQLTLASQCYRRAAETNVQAEMESAATAEFEMWSGAGDSLRALASLDALAERRPGSLLKLQADMTRRSMAMVGHSAPELASETTEGEPVTLAGLHGRFVLVFFWATYSLACIEQIPSLRRLAATYRGRSLEVLGVSLDFPNDRRLVQSSMVRRGLPWRTLFPGGDFDNPIARRYGVLQLPYSVLVGPSGQVLAAGLQGPALEAAISRALEGR
ncbi:MAG: TlpA family protein disulfide reductase [Candidatus Wallbacteria bacterium]|nr:TlpA family protein disulfide reductase [Candidatus Wallbacteria bacterium]